MIWEHIVWENFYKKNAAMKNVKNIIFSRISNFLIIHGKQYGLVGGKTNYPLPDILFGYLSKNDNRISRTFLDDKQLQ